MPSVDVSKFRPKGFFDKFLSDSRPLVVRNYAKEWAATAKWQDKKYLAELGGNTVVRLQAFNKFPFADLQEKRKAL